MTYLAVAEAFSEERPIYVALAEHIENTLKDEVKAGGISATVTSRAKDVDSFVMKALIGARYSDPISQIGDKAGVRVTVPYAEDTARVEAIVREKFQVIQREQKLDALAYNESGYLGVHLDVRIRDEELDRVEVSFAGRRVEVQIRTIAQGAWAAVSHQQLYKPAADVPNELKRRIFRLVSLVELFDNEVQGFLDEARETPGFAEAQALVPLTEALLRRFDIRTRPDRQLSLAMAAALVPLYQPCAPERVYDEIVGRWIDEHDDGLRNVLDEAQADATNPILRQPECFIVLERLERDRLRLQNAWPADVPEEWLRATAEAWGVSL